MTTWTSLELTEGASTIMTLMINFHDYMMVLLLLILGFVSYLFVVLTTSKTSDKNLIDSHMLELIWTLLPMVILLFMAFPSLYLLYLTEDTINHNLSVKVIGHQWYWEYEYNLPDSTRSFDSYMAPYSPSQLRNLDVDNRLALPVFSHALALVGSADVLHSWTLPSLGVKVDAIPGRLNSLTLCASHSGVFYGQCSELCGSNHSFMPIVVEAVHMKEYINFLYSY